MRTPGFFLFSSGREAQGLWSQQRTSEAHGDISASMLGGHMLGVIFSELGIEPEVLYFIHSFVQHDLGC